MMLAVNLGSRGLDAARAFVEYVNHPGGSYWSDLRAKNGRKEPWNCRLWCLGNEMDGPWQVGHKSAAEYGHLANETAKALRGLIRRWNWLSAARRTPTWRHTRNGRRPSRGDLRSSRLHLPAHVFRELRKKYCRVPGSAEKLDRYIGTVSGIIDFVKAKSRSKRDVKISFDEWNVWYHERKSDAERMKKWDWPEAPACLRTSTISRMSCRSDASSTRLFAAPMWFASRASLNWST